MVVVLVEMSGDPRLIDKKNVRATRETFYDAFAKAFAAKPLTVEEIGRWLQKNPLDWEYVFREWQFTDEAFLARVAPEDPSRSGVAMLVYNAKGKMPPFVVRPTRGDCSPGIVLDFVDPKNFQLLRVQSNGRISHNAKINGTWDTSKIVGS
ncbi:MAG TPA: hypothetical protein DEB39_09585, partial [Planctomycetaceae bacterium]|nr:hypothetical protein [Planctomycetaceae bacterium]